MNQLNLMEFDKEATITCDGYLLPNVREGSWKPAIDSEGNVIFECYTLPMDFITVKAYGLTEYISTNHWLIEILGEPIAFSRVEFPVLDALVDDNSVALVKLYRAKKEDTKKGLNE
jgi:hypothetical protein